jgi:Tfp pilus assembly protein PilV
MTCHSEHPKSGPHRGFTLIEAMAATVLLAFIGASIWLVLERCMVSAADSTQRMRAFEIVRENMEKILASTSVEESTEFGISEKFPDIRWHNTVESFYEPLTFRMWVRAVCIAEYTDTAGETRSVELIHWLTDLTDEQVQQLTKRKELLEKRLEQHLIETEELAAQYVGVDVQTIREWVRNGMPTFYGAFLKPWLEFYYYADGTPTEEQKQEFIKHYPELAELEKSKAESTDAPEMTGDEQELPPPPPGTPEWFTQEDDDTE